MGQEPREVIRPAEQATITFFGHEVVAVRLPDGRIAAVFNMLCEAMRLSRSGQLERVQADDILSGQLLQCEVQTAGGLQDVNVLTAWAIPMWLTGVRLSRLAPEKRSAVLQFKLKAADILYQYFSEPHEALPAPSTLVPAEPVTRPARPSDGADSMTWAEYHHQMAAWYEWQGDVERWRAGVEDRLESVEEITRLVPEILERLGPAGLSIEHQETVQAMVKRLHELTGATFGGIYGELYRTFQVPRYTEIPENRWGEVASWFKTRLAVARPRQ